MENTHFSCQHQQQEQHTPLESSEATHCTDDGVSVVLHIHSIVQLYLCIVYHRLV